MTWQACEQMLTKQQITCKTLNRKYCTFAKKKGGDIWVCGGNEWVQGYGGTNVQYMATPIFA